jgi:hypothetical protein
MGCARSLTALRGLFVILLGALTVVHAHSPDHRNVHGRRSVKSISASPWEGTSVYKQIGTSGVSAMQMSVIDNRYVILFDRADHNPLHTSDGNNAWSALLDTHGHKVRALKLLTNSFCAGELLLPLPTSDVEIQSALVPVDLWRFSRRGVA